MKSLSTKEKIISFVWQHFLLIISLFIMTFGVALCVRSALGSSVISTIPFVMSLAGQVDLAPALTIGEYTYIMNFVLVLGQILVLRRKFELVQLLQLVIGFLFGFLLDVNMALVSVFPYDTFLECMGAQIIGCTVLAFGIAAEIRCGSVTMPGEGMPVAITRVTRLTFPVAKIIIDITLVVIAVLCGYYYFGCWKWDVVGPGTLFAMIYVGAAVKFINPRMTWFERILDYTPRFRRYLYGLARFVSYRRQ